MPLWSVLGLPAASAPRVARRDAVRLGTDRGTVWRARPPDWLAVVELNRAIAVAATEGPETGMRIVDQLGLDDFRYLHSTGPSSCDVSGAPTRRVTPIDVGDNSPTTAPNVASSNVG